MDPVTLGLAAVSLGAQLFGGIAKRRAERKAGRRQAREHRRRAGEFRQAGERMVEDLQEEGSQVLGTQQQAYAGFGGRVRGERSALGEGDIEIGEFDREAAMVTARESAQGRLEEYQREYDRVDDPGNYERMRLHTLRAAASDKALKRQVDVMEEKWGRNLAKMDLPDLTEDITRVVREGGGSLMAVQNATLENIEKNILRTVEDTRRAMAHEYRSARRARKGRSTSGFDVMSTVLSGATDAYSTYKKFEALAPDR